MRFLMSEVPLYRARRKSEVQGLGAGGWGLGLGFMGQDLGFRVSGGGYRARWKSEVAFGRASTGVPRS